MSHLDQAAALAKVDNRFRQMAVDLDMTGAEFCRRAVIGEMDAREIED